MSHDSSQMITFSQYLLPVATFIIGSWLVPKMDWMSTKLKTWLFAFGIGLFAFWLLSNFTQKFLMDLTRQNNIAVIIIIICLSIIIFVISGIFINKQNINYEIIKHLKTEGYQLLCEINHFCASRKASEPIFPVVHSSRDMRQQMEQFNTDEDIYRHQTASQFTSTYRQRIADWGNKLYQRNIITQREFKKLGWSNRPDDPVIHWIVGDIDNFLSKLK